MDIEKFDLFFVLFFVTSFLRRLFRVLCPVICVLLVLIQACFLDYYLVFYNNSTWCAWLIADWMVAVLIAVSLVLSNRYYWLVREVGSLKRANKTIA
jgi:uncharacterized protein YqgC (DUF456 family)